MGNYSHPSRLKILAAAVMEEKKLVLHNQSIISTFLLLNYYRIHSSSEGTKT